MSLFLVNRYLGDGDDDDSSNKESRSKALLAMLQKKAKEKEKLSLTSPNERRPDVRTDGQRTTTTKKKKERKEKKERKASENGEHTPIPLKRKREEVTQTSSGAGWTKKAKKSSQKTKKNVESVPSPPDSPETGKDEQLENTDEGEEEEEGEEKTEEEGEQQVKEGEDLLSDQSKQATEESLTQSGFTILGGFEEKQIRKVHRVLPQWLAQPDVIHRDIKSNLVSIAEVEGICPALVKKLEANGIQHFFPVQAEVIPAILESVAHGLLVGRGGYRPRDVCVSAPTGSGKTLAFVIPIVQALMHRVVCEVRALVVLPTKELAQQVCKVFSLYSEGTGLKVVMIAGQKSFAAEQASLSEERCGSRRSLADIAVATPGRLVDHINKNSGFSLEHLRFLIIDEADRLIDSMHHSWLGQVSRAVFRTGSDATTSIFSRTEPADITAASLSPPQMPLQKLLFSATLTMNPEKLQQLRLHQPRLFSSVHSKQPNATGSQERFNFPEALTEYYVPCTMSSKPLAILHHVLRMKFSPVLCFTNSRETAHRLYLLVKLFGGVEVAEFSSRLSPGERKQTLRDFEQGNIQLLISTDAAARGIDVRGIKCVVNYDAPQYIRTYMHRIGRTARAGKAGLAFTFLLKVQRSDFLQMVADAGSPGIRKHVVKRRSLESMAARYKQALQELAGVIKEEKEKHRIRS